MKESFLADIPHKIKHPIISFFLSRTIEPLQKGGLDALRALIPSHLDNNRVAPEFLQEENPQFQEMRKKLNTQSGIIICNHPVAFESSLILSVVTRNDLKIMVAKEIYDGLPPEIAAKYFFSADKSKSKLAVT